MTLGKQCIVYGVLEIGEGLYEHHCSVRKACKMQYYILLLLLAKCSRFRRMAWKTWFFFRSKRIIFRNLTEKN